jgi:hypothetical protein
MAQSEKFSAKVSVVWDFDSNRTQRTQEAYKLESKLLSQVGGIEENYPRDVIQSRVRVRGRGETMVVRFEATEGKDLILLGYSLEGNAETEGNRRD